MKYEKVEWGIGGPIFIMNFDFHENLRKRVVIMLNLDCIKRYLVSFSQ